jgi:outer membrane PBP1 activator LpoA protein
MIKVMMRGLQVFVVVMGSLLPMATFAYEHEEWQGVTSTQAMQSVNQKPPAVQLLANASFKSNRANRLEGQVQRIDQEIMLLRAELARKHNDLNQVRNYVNQLNRIVLLPVFEQRLASLRLYLTSAKGSHSPLDSYLFVGGIEALPFPEANEKSIVVILLPLTGPYEAAGNRILSGLTESLEKISFKGTLVVFDTALYASMFKLWEMVKYYEPDFIFGPLQKQAAQQWQALNTGIPTLYFNSMDRLFGHERALSLSKSKGLAQVLSILEDRQFRNILVLTDASESSKQLESEFYQAWSSSYSQGQYQHQPIGRTVSESIEKALNIERSAARYLWLQKMVDRPLDFTPRARQDFEAVVSFIPLKKAIQVGPILGFHQLTHVTHVWYPNHLPTQDALKKYLSSWQQTYAVLPVHVDPESPSDNAETTRQDKNGLFYALGHTAVEIVKNSAIADGLNLHVDTEFGAVVSNRVGQFHLLPVVYWIDQGVFDRVNFQKNELYSQ